MTMTALTQRARDVAGEAKELLDHLNAVPFAHEYRMHGETYAQIVDVIRGLLADRAEWAEPERLHWGEG